MKKNKIFIALIPLFLFAIVGTASAFVYEKLSYGGNYVLTATQEQEENVAIVMTLPSLSGATSTILVDLSDGTMFPHYQTSGQIVISRIKAIWETGPNDVASTTLKFGVIASTTPSGNLSDVKYFDRIDFSTDDKTYQQVTLDYTPSLMKLGLSSATTTGFLTNDTDMATTSFATTTAYTSPRGAFTVKPGVGDLIMSVYKQNGTASTTIQVFYHVK